MYLAAKADRASVGPPVRRLHGSQEMPGASIKVNEENYYSVLQRKAPMCRTEERCKYSTTKALMGAFVAERFVARAHHCETCMMAVVEVHG